jgi:hypothetical protein
MSLAEQLAARKAKLNVAPKVEPKVDLDPADAQAEVCPSVANLDGARRRGVTSQESSKAADEAPPCPATTVLEGAPRDELRRRHGAASRACRDPVVQRHGSDRGDENEHSAGTNESDMRVTNLFFTGS